METLLSLSLRELEERIEQVFYDPSEITASFVQEIRDHLEEPTTALEFRTISQMVFCEPNKTRADLNLIIKFIEESDDQTFMLVPISSHYILPEEERSVLLALAYSMRALMEATPSESYDSYERSIENAHSCEAGRRLLPYLHYNYAEFCVSEENFRLALRNYKLSVENSVEGQKIYIMANNGQHRICQVAYKIKTDRATEKKISFRRKAEEQQPFIQLDQELEHRIAQKAEEIREARFSNELPRCTSAKVGGIKHICSEASNLKSNSVNGEKKKMPEVKSFKPQSTTNACVGVYYQRRMTPKLAITPSMEDNTELLDSEFLEPVRNTFECLEILQNNSTFCYNAKINEYDNTFHHVKCCPPPVPRLLCVPDEESIIGVREFAVQEGWKRAVESRSPSIPLRGGSSYWDCK